MERVSSPGFTTGLGGHLVSESPQSPAALSRCTELPPDLRVEPGRAGTFLLAGLRKPSPATTSATGPGPQCRQADWSRQVFSLVSSSTQQVNVAFLWPNMLNVSISTSENLLWETQVSPAVPFLRTLIF